MPEPHHLAVALDQVVEAARATGDQWRVQQHPNSAPRGIEASHVRGEQAEVASVDTVRTIWSAIRAPCH